MLISLYKDDTILEARATGVTAIDKLRERKISEVAVYFPTIGEEANTKAFIQSFMMWNYKFELKSLAGTSLLTNISLNFPDSSKDTLKFENDLKALVVYVKSCIFARDVQNTRANIATCQYMEDLIKVRNLLHLHRTQSKDVTRLPKSMSSRIKSLWYVLN